MPTHEACLNIERGHVFRKTEEETEEDVIVSIPYDIIVDVILERLKDQEEIDNDENLQEKPVATAGVFRADEIPPELLRKVAGRSKRKREKEAATQLMTATSSSAASSSSRVTKKTRRGGY